jgi:DNA polymerase elongation subunit (family B)
MPKNINLDFSSLYPNIMTAYDIGPQVDELLRQRKIQKLREERIKKLKKINNINGKEN